MLKEIKIFLHKINAVKELIIAGDFNQDISGDETQQFYREIGVHDFLSEHERIPWNDRDVTLKCGSRFIESIAVSEALMPFVEGFEVTRWDEKVSADHRGHVIELCLEFF